MIVVIWMAGALISLSFVAIGARELAGGMTTFQILFFRSLFGLIVITLLLIKSKRFELFSTKRIKLHMIRNLFHFIGQFGWFLGLGLLPLAHVFALEFNVPMWTLVIATLFLNEGITLRKIIAVLLGVAGVLIILKPGIAIIETASIIVLLAAFGFALSHVTTKSLSNTEDSMTVLFYMCLVQLPLGLVLSIKGWMFPDLQQTLWLVIISLMALTAHYCITNAMKLADAGIVVTLDFLRLPLIAIVGVIFYNEQFELAVILGAVLMLFGNLLNIKTLKSKHVLGVNSAD